MPSLYVYVYHGNNTWGTSHFEKLFKSAQKLSDGTSSLIGSIVNNEFSFEAASELISQPKIFKEFDYFRSWTNSPSSV
jgi:hypothetical protein